MLQTIDTITTIFDPIESEVWKIKALQHLGAKIYRLENQASVPSLI